MYLPLYNQIKPVRPCMLSLKRTFIYVPCDDVKSINYLFSDGNIRAGVTQFSRNTLNVKCR